jgi:hypothetical protein
MDHSPLGHSGSCEVMLDLEKIKRVSSILLEIERYWIELYD